MDHEPDANHTNAQADGEDRLVAADVQHHNVRATVCVCMKYVRPGLDDRPVVQEARCKRKSQTANKHKSTQPMTSIAIIEAT